MSLFTRRTIQTAGAALLGVVALSGCYPYKTEPVAAVGFAAQFTCSGVFVSGMTQQVAYDQLIRPAVRYLVYDAAAYAPTVTVTNTATSKSVRATLTYGGQNYESTSVYRPGLGCTTLVSQTEASLRAQPFTLSPAAAPSPTQPWPVGEGAPETAGLSSNAITQINAAVAPMFTNTTSVNTLGVAISYQGKLIHESYATGRGITASTPLFGFSATKTVLGLGLGIMSDAGAFKVDDKLPVKSWESDATRKSTWRHFLNQDSGLSWVELPTASRYSNVTPMLFQSFDQAAYVASLPQVADGGTQHLYSTGNSVLLTRMLENILLARAKLPNTPANSLKVTSDFFQKNLFAKARVSSATFQADEVGTFGGGSYLIMKTRDWLRLGQLVHDGGRVGTTQVVSTDWIDTVMRKPSPKDPAYGGHLWLGKLADKATECSGMNDDAMWFSGYGGQRLIIVPSRKVVFARLGLTNAVDQANGLTFATLCKVLAQLPQ